MLKKIALALVGVFVLFVVVVVLVFSRINALTKVAIEHGTTVALGVEGKVASVDVSFSDESVTVERLNIANAPGFDSPFLLDSERLHVAIDSSSFFSDTIEVSVIELTGLTLHIDQKGDSTNIKYITEHLGSLGSPTEEDPPGTTEEPEAKGKKLRVAQIVIRDITANIHSDKLGALSEDLSVKVSEIVLNDVTPENASGLLLPELIQRLIPVIIASVLENGLNVIPVDLQGVLSSDVGELALRVGGEVTSLLGQVGGVGVQIAKTLANDLAPAVEEATKGIGEGVKGIGDGLKGILGGNKDK